MKIRLLFSFLGTLIILFVAVPVLRMLLAVQSPEFIQTAFQDEVLSSVALTLRASLWATVIALLLGVPLAYLLAREDFPGKKIIESLIDIPVVIPHTAAGIALLMVWGRQSFSWAKLTTIYAFLPVFLCIRLDPFNSK